RTSLALALLTGKPFQLTNIRANRAKPGLQPQHLMCVRAAAAVGQATVRGASLHSNALDFEPGEVAPGKYTFPIGTAGATSLVLHTLYLPLAFRACIPSEITITGGTHVTHSPSFHCLETTGRGYMDHIGLRVGVQIRHPRFYPRGGGVLVAHVQPCAAIRGFRLGDVPPVRNASVLSAVARLPENVAKRQARRAAYRLQQAGITAEVREETWDAGP